jgi:flagellar hook protein FlgE
MALLDSLSTGVSAMQGFSEQLDVIGNNIANVSTTGFKSSNVNFEDSFSNTLNGASNTGNSATSVTPMQVGTGVDVASIAGDFSQGTLVSTGVNTNLAVSGNGFFQVENPATSQVYATRDGTFSINSQGYLVTTDGYYVQGLTGGSAGNPPATVGNIKLGTPPAGTQLESFTIDSGGNVNELYSDGSTAVTNQVLLQSYSNPAALSQVGDNLYSSSAAAGPIGGSALTAANNVAGANGLGSIQSGSLEQSNVDLTTQFADMITAERSFQASSRVISVSDQVLQEIVNLTH